MTWPLYIMSLQRNGCLQETCTKKQRRASWVDRESAGVGEETRDDSVYVWVNVITLHYIHVVYMNEIFNWKIWACRKTRRVFPGKSCLHTWWPRPPETCVETRLQWQCFGNCGRKEAVTQCLLPPEKDIAHQGGFGRSLHTHVGWGWEDRLASGNLEEESGGERCKWRKGGETHWGNSTESGLLAAGRAGETELLCHTESRGAFVRRVGSPWVFNPHCHASSFSFFFFFFPTHVKWLRLRAMLFW